MTTRTKAFLLFLGVSALYLATRSAALDEWDSFQFAMGVQHFDLWQHQPHPPGYPLYVFFGWLGAHLFHWDPGFALQVASCLGGALLVTAWFLIARFQFNERFAWLLAVSLTVTPIFWMTSTKVMSDACASAFLCLELYFALCFAVHARRREKDSVIPSGAAGEVEGSRRETIQPPSTNSGETFTAAPRDSSTPPHGFARNDSVGESLRTLLAAAFLGAIAAGVRPQNTGIILFILIFFLIRGRASRKHWATALALFFAGSLLWLLPMWKMQADLRPDLPFWSVYPKQLFQQWSWRLNRPNVYIGAYGFHLRDLAIKFGSHFGGWFGVGFGFIANAVTLVLGLLLTLIGLLFFWRRRDTHDRAFWRDHWPWAALYLLIIFCCLPAYQRYYLPILPLVAIIILRGLVVLDARWRLTSSLFPALLLAISLPLVWHSHREEGPPVKFVRYLKKKYPPAQRPRVILILTECERPVEWYAPQFDIVTHEDRLSNLPAAKLSAATAIYADNTNLILPPGWHFEREAIFHRSRLIDPKHRDIGVYRLEHKP